MRLIAVAAAAALAVSGVPTATAKQDNGAEELRKGLAALAGQGDQPPGQSKRPDDPDMGDDNASRTAYLTVCFKDTPAADRSAICDRSPTSPN